MPTEDTTPQTDPPQADPPTVTDPPAPAGDRGDAVSMTRAELDRQLADARRSGERSARESQEIKDLRAKAKELDDLKGQSQSAEERLTRELGETKQQVESYATKYRRTLVRTAFDRAARAKGVADEDIDFLFNAVQGQVSNLVTVDEETDAVQGIDQLIAAIPASLLERLTTGGRQPAPNLNAGRQGENQHTKRAAEIEQARKELQATGKYTL